MSGQKCLTRCREWKQNSKDISVVIAQLEREIAALGPQRPVNAGSQRIAEMASFFGVQRDKTITLDTLFTPLLTTLFFEIGSIVSLGFAFRARVERPVEILAADRVEVGTTRAVQVKAFVDAYRAKHGQDPSFSEVRYRLRLPPATASKYRQLAIR